ILHLLKQSNLLLATFIGAFFYSFNLYTITFWHGGVIDGTFLVFTIAPVLLYVVISILMQGFSLQKNIFLVLCIISTINTGPYAFALYISILLPAIFFRIPKG